jgi:hypothetical protein
MGAAAIHASATLGASQRWVLEERQERRAYRQDPRPQVERDLRQREPPRLQNPRILAFEQPVVPFADCGVLSLRNDLLPTPALQVAQVLPGAPGDHAGVGCGLGMHRLTGQEPASSAISASRGIAVRGVLLQRLQADILQVSRNRRTAAPRQNRILRADRLQQLAGALGAEGALAGQQFV